MAAGILRIGDGMAVAPTGILSTPVDLLRTTIATSAAFQTWVGATGTPGEKLAFAKARVYVTREETFTLPCAIVDLGRTERTSIAVGVTEARGSVVAQFQAPISGSHDDADAAYTFENVVGAIVAEMEGLIGPAYLAFTNARSLQPRPQRPKEDEAKTVTDFYFWDWEFDYLGT